ncbi:MAG: Rieske 2Fe-2S domain-containing protein [Halioglobus sp.]|nr:Rieske 2Fe-2S domain-containing protein [Halioglobus sp.]
MANRYDQPIPYGWFAVEYSDKLGNRGVMPLRYFGRDLVLFRTEAGAAVLMDAFCPHLGAHLGHGGKVQGENIACPFHGWQFDGAGYCQDVPYASNMPPRVVDKQVIRTYPVIERNAMIWGWYHPNGAAPEWDVEQIPEFNSDEWTDLDLYDWEINTIIQEAGENGADVAHFMFVHSATEMPEGEVSMDGVRRSTEIRNKVPRINDTGELAGSGEDWEYIEVNSLNVGPGQTIQRISRAFSVVMMGTVTPIDDQNIHLRFSFTMPRSQTDMNKVLAEATRDNVVMGVGQDIPIWNNKSYVPDPILCDGDGPIAKYRKWFTQFYAA